MASKAFEISQRSSLNTHIGDATNPHSTTAEQTGAAPLESLTTLGHRNKIMNGQFEINQRGAISYTATGYTLDRWRLSVGNGASCEVLQGNLGAGQTIIPGNGTNYLRWKRTAAGTSGSLITQPIEGVRTLSGKTCTLTMWAKATANTTFIPRVRQNFGTGGSPSATRLVGNDGDKSLTTDWQKISYTFVMSSVEGKTLGTNGDDYVEIYLSWQNDAPNPTNEIRIANVSLVEGDATAEEDPGAWRDRSVELLMCQRYFLDGGIGKRSQ